MAAAVLALLLSSVVVGALPAQADTDDLFFSEYVEGSSSNKAIEIFNGTGAPVDLSQYTLRLYSNGSATASATRTLTGTLDDGDVFVGAHSLANAAILAVANDTVNGGVYNWNGDDAVTLSHGSTVIDVFGQVGTDPGTEWGTGLTSTADNTLRRKADVLAGDPDGSNAFDPSVEWDGFAQDTFDGLGTHTVNDDEPGVDDAPAVASTVPAGGAADVELNSNVTVTFSEDVDVAAGWYALTCSVSGTHPASVTGGPKAYVLDPTTDFSYGDTCTIAVEADAVSDRDGVDPVHPAADFSSSFTTLATAPCEAPFTSIHEIQGAGTASPAAGQTRTTEGVVTGDFQGGSGMNGFFIQEPNPDTDPLTSEGVFVFVPAASPFASLAVQEGDTVHLRGRVTEFQNQTEIDNLDQLVVCGSGASIPATTVTLPETTNGELERYEAMKVSIPQTLTVQQNFFQGRYGQLTLGSGGRLYQPTNQFPAGSPEALALADANSRALLVLDDAVSAQNRDPVPFLGAGNIRRAGDTVSGIAGILDEGAINSNTAIRDYRVQVTSQPTFSQDNKRTAAPEEVGGNLKVASFNVLNYFTTLTSEDPDARGADTALERERQGKKIWSAMKAIDADVFGLMEIENRPNANATAAFVEGLNQYIVDNGGPANSYTAVPNPTTGTGDDFIKVAMIYKSSKVTPVGPSLSDPDEINDRPTLAQTFSLNANGEKVSVVVNHFKSKGSCPTGTGPDADNGDGQGCWNAKRVLQAERLLEFIDAVTTAAGDEDALVIGDLNSYGKEDPILALEEGGLVNQLDRFVGDDAYSYVFDGLSGYLDHGLATASASSQVVGATEWHINADEPSVIDYNTEFKTPGQVTGLYSPDPYRSSDHDPVVLGLQLGGCSFTDDAKHRIRRLNGDCSTGKTILVPNGWTLDGDGHTITAYDPSGDHFRGAVVANAGKVANVVDLTVTGRQLADVCDADGDRLRGILLDGASGVLHGNSVVDLRQNGSGCQEGNGIEVRNAPFSKGGRDVYVAVTANTVRGYQKGGIVINGSVESLVYGNTVRGLGRVPYIAQNGVQVGFGASALVERNTIVNNYYTGTADAQACGVLFYEADDAKEKKNTFSGNQRNVCTVKPPKVKKHR